MERALTAKKFIKMNTVIITKIPLVNKPQILEYCGYTITNRTGDSHCALIYKGVKLTQKALDNPDNLVKCIAGDIAKKNGVFSHNAVEKAKSFIDSIA
jgi:hypothetical protein